MNNSNTNYNEKYQKDEAWQGERKLLIGRYSHEKHGDTVSVSLSVGMK